ncbi:MAG: cysteine--tRNA ligase [Patescibacteria group bacterium]
MLKIFNTLTRKKEVFKPLHKDKIGIYSCGPTVYWNQHIGHMYAYVQWDCLVRTLKYLGNKVEWVMNITDVGHLISDEDTGEDKMEKGAKRENLSVWEIADKYINQFKESMETLNIQKPDILCRATEHINEQINLIKKIEKNGFTYKTSTGLIFNTSKFKNYAKFAKLNLEKQKAGARVNVDPEKKRPWDFLLWITNQPQHIMQWNSPWGSGFPGWHIECTAMSVKYLGEKFDIHTGGKEHIPVHHTNEIAQAFGAFNHQTANYWMHNEWLMFDGKKISKSLGNSILVSDLKRKGYDPLSLRYLILTSHYRQGLNFTWESLKAAETAYKSLKYRLTLLKKSVRKKNKEIISKSDMGKKNITDFNKKFETAISDDLNMPMALASIHEFIYELNLLKNKNQLYPKTAKSAYKEILKADEVLGLELKEIPEIPAKIMNLAEKRELLRKNKQFIQSDGLRKEIEKLGYIIEDTPEGPVILHK